MAADFTALTKTLYDLQKAQQPVGFKGSPLDQLVVENFDEEQIWQELELENPPALEQFEESVSQVTVDTGLKILEEVEEDVGVDEGGEVDDENDDDDEDDDEDKDQSDDEIDEGEEERENQAEVGDKDGDGFSDEDSDVDFDVDALEKETKQKMDQKGPAARQPKQAETSEVDDKFFRLSDMDAFLDDMDRREGKDDKGGEDVDYFQDLPSGDEEDLAFDKPTVSKQQKTVIMV